MLRVPERYHDRSDLGAPRRRAMVLVFVLIVVAMIALAGFSFAELMLTENKATHLHGDSLALEQAISSGVELLELMAEQPPQTRAMSGGWFDNAAAFRAIRLLPDDRSARQPIRQLCFSVVSPVMDQGVVSGLRFGVENESARLHLADVLRWEQDKPGGGRSALMKLPGMTDAVADAILDWIDSDSEPRGMGAESDFYAGLDPPYSARNALPECIDELLLVKGVTRQMLFGADANYNHQVEPHEMIEGGRGAASESLAAESVPWASLLTLYSGYKNVTAEGAPRIDLNQMDLTKLNRDLTAAVGANWAAFIVALRQYGPYAGPDAGTPDPPTVNPSAAPRYVFGSALDLVGVRVAVPSTTSGQSPKVFSSQLSGDSAGSSPELARLLDKTTAVNVPVIRGTVSVNHASREVLRTVPGIDDALADRISSARDNQSSQNTAARRFPTWLLSEGLVDLATMKTLMPNVCAEGDVVRAEVIGHFEPAGQWSRAEVVIDATTAPARPVLWHDLRVFGSGYPAEWFGDEATGAEAGRRPQRQRTARPAGG